MWVKGERKYNTPFLTAPAPVSRSATQDFSVHPRCSKVHPRQILGKYPDYHTMHLSGSGLHPNECIEPQRGIEEGFIIIDTYAFSRTVDSSFPVKWSELYVNMCLKQRLHSTPYAAVITWLKLCLTAQKFSSKNENRCKGICNTCFKRVCRHNSVILHPSSITAPIWASRGEIIAKRGLTQKVFELLQL